MAKVKNTKEIKLHETLPRLVAAKGFKGKRKELAAQIGVGAGALSQYEKGSALPSLGVAVNLASALEVSMEELLFGTLPEVPRTFDAAPYFRNFDNTLSDIQSRVTQHSWMVSEIASLVANRIDKAADRLLKAESARAAAGEPDARLLRLPTSRLPGIISDKTTYALEDNSVNSFIASTNFFYEMQIIGGEEVPGGFLPVMLENLRRDRHYRFLYSPNAPGAAQKISNIRDFFSRELGSPQRMQSLFKVKRAREPFAIGYCLYEIDVNSLQHREAALRSTLRQFLDQENRLGYVIPPNRLVQGDILVETDRMSEFVSYVEQAWKKGVEV